MMAGWTRSLMAAALCVAVAGCSTEGDAPAENDDSQQSSSGLRPAGDESTDSQSTAPAEKTQAPVSDMTPEQVADSGLRAAAPAPEAIPELDPQVQTAAISSPRAFEPEFRPADEKDREDESRSEARRSRDADLDADDDDIRPRGNTYPYRRHRPLRGGIRSVAVAPPMFASPFVSAMPAGSGGLGGEGATSGGEEVSLEGEGTEGEISQLEDGTFLGTIDLTGPGSEFGFDDFDSPDGFGELPDPSTFGPEEFGPPDEFQSGPESGEFDLVDDPLVDVFEEFEPPEPEFPDGGGPTDPSGETPGGPPDDGGLDPGEPVPPPDF